MADPAPIGSSPIQSVLLVARFHWEKPFTCDAHSLPGHLLQLIVTGRIRAECNGRQYTLRAGDVVWNYDDERVFVEVLEAPLITYSINFAAPALPPPEVNERISRANARVIGLFDQLYRMWKDRRLPPATRELRAHVALLQILDGLTTPRSGATGLIRARACGGRSRRNCGGICDSRSRSGAWR